MQFINFGLDVHSIKPHAHASLLEVKRYLKNLEILCVFHIITLKILILNFGQSIPSNEDKDIKVVSFEQNEITLNIMRKYSSS